MYFRIEHRMGIAAPAADVWAVLGDLPSWPQWTSLYPQLSGGLRIGQRISLTEQVPGFQPQTLNPVIVDWVPNAQILWRLTQSAGLLKRTRYFEIESLSDTGCVFSNGEYYDGLWARSVSRARRRAVRSAYEAFSQSLSAAVEARR